MNVNDLLASRDCVTVGCPYEADGTDQLCRHCRAYQGRLKPRPRLQLVHSREETPMPSTRTCEQPGCDSPTCSDRGRYARVCQEHKHIVTERLRADRPPLAAVPDPEPVIPTKEELIAEGEWPLLVDENGLDGADAGWVAAHAALLELHVEKSATYGSNADRLANFTTVGRVTGEPAERYALVRIIEKATRALNMIDLTGQADEVREYPDMASLALICETLRRRRS